jgi:hypothetical protein
MPRATFGIALVAGLAAVVAMGAAAQNQQVYRYVDKEGRVVYSDRGPPADARDVQSKRLRGNVIENNEMPLAAQQAQERFPVTLYSFGCGEVCTAAEALLNRRGVPYSAVNVETRAGRRLIITGAGDGIKDKWLEEKRRGWQFEAAAYFDLIMPAAAMMCLECGKDINDIVRMISAGASEEIKEDRAQKLKALFDEAEKAAEADLFEGYAFNGDLGIPSKVSVTAVKKLKEQAATVKVLPQFMPDESGLTAAEKGTLMHKALQRSGLAKKSAEEVRRLLKELVSEGIFDSAAEEAIDAQSIAEFLNGAL